MNSATDFGKALRRQREQRGIALKAIAEQTKIGHTFLVALERGDCSKWPGGIYSRAWIRAYATAIGLDSDDVAARFIKCFAQNAFPDGDPTPPVPADLPRITPLRLTLEADPQERFRVVTRRSLLFVVDLLIALSAAAVVSGLTAVGFWTAFASATLACHAVGLFGGGGSAAGWVDRFVRRHARPHDQPADAAIAEAA
ncbi:MAG TPA: helix-turn-helix domain-containing protein [Vicinamibacterales bacterium]|nr:helix-turn-helix domain-containing protein [Vicinamibacterales bacterium]